MREVRSPARPHSQASRSWACWRSASFRERRYSGSQLPPGCWPRSRCTCCSGGAELSSRPMPDPAWLVPRPTLHGSRHGISSGHHLASAAGFAVLEAGGNAVDAGCAAGIALAVLHADEVNFAGVAPIMIRTAEGRVVTIDGLGTWPRRIPADLFIAEHGGTIPLGVLRTVIPAAPDAWITALSDF